MSALHPEQDWINQIKQGDSEAIKKLYIDCFPYCANFLYKMGADTETAKELFSEAVSIFYEKLVAGFTLNPNCAVKTYLCAIVKNKWLAKRKGNNRFEDLDEQYENLPDLSNEDLEEKNWKEEKKKEMKEAIANMSPRCREVLTKFYIHGLSLDEIAEQLGITKAALKVTKTRCMNQLKEKFKK